jgi:hypothetical protein
MNTHSLKNKLSTTDAASIGNLTRHVQGLELQDAGGMGVLLALFTTVPE